jgi:hypothetical protein
MIKALLVGGHPSDFEDFDSVFPASGVTDQSSSQLRTCAKGARASMLFWQLSMGKYGEMK